VAANPNILANLKSYVGDKTGKTFDGDPPTGGDKGKGTPAAKPPERIPMFKAEDPKSRRAYLDAIVKKYNLPHGYGDTFTRFNEIPSSSEADTLTSKELALKMAKASGLPPSLLYSSAMVEGMSGLYPQILKGSKEESVDFSGDEKYPVPGFRNFGLDTFSDAYPGLVKKGLLPADFNKRFIKSVHTNEQNKKVNSANFDSAEAGLQAKAAMMKDAQDQFNAYAAQNKIPLSDRARQFFALAAYNGGPGAAKTLLQEYQKSGTLANDAFLKTRPAQSRYNQVYDNVMQRFSLANALDSEGYFEPPPQTTVTSK